MAIIQSLPLGGSGSAYTNMTTDEAIAGTNTEERVVSAKVLNDAIDTKISDLVNSAPETLDTLNELASALGNDPNFATTIAGQIGTKANDSDAVHKSGNETIGGVKTFNNGIVSNVTGTGALTLQSKSGTSRIYLRDDNASGFPSSVNFYSKVGDNPEYGVFLTGNMFHPTTDGEMLLGYANRKWKDVYATTLHGDVDFSITEAQIAAIVV